MKDKSFKLCLVLHVVGKSNIPDHLERQIEVFMRETVIPLLESLKNSSEGMNISIAIVDCDEAEDVTIHKCLAEVSFNKNNTDP